MKMLKRVLAIAMAITMTLACMTVTSVAEIVEPVEEFYAVFNTAAEDDKVANTLSFYYDTNKDIHSEVNTKTVYGNFPTDATEGADWEYDDIRDNVKNVVIDSSVADYHGLKCTAFMFFKMINADDISGCEYLDVSNVANFKCMFSFYGSDSETITTVPNVSSWNTSNATKMTQVFSRYAFSSKSITAVPDVSNWDTGKLQYSDDAFSQYAYSSTVITSVPDVSNWKMGNIINMQNMFSNYAYSSESITAVPDVSSWNTGKVKNMKNMFSSYAYSSTSKLDPLDLSSWDIKTVQATGSYGASKLFENYAHSNKQGDPVVYATDWSTTTASPSNSDMFTGSALRNANKVTLGEEQWSYANTGKDGCFDIAPEPTPIDDAVVTLKGDVLVESGQEQTQEVESVTLEGWDKEITYKVTGNKATKAGTYFLTITGTGEYTGEIVVPFVILEAPKTEEEITPISNKVVVKPCGEEGGEVSIEVNPGKDIKTVEINMNANDVIVAVASANDLNRVAQGDNLAIWVDAEIKENMSSEEGKAAVDKLLDGKTFGGCIGIELYKQMSGEDATQITNTNNNASIMLVTKIADELKGAYKDFGIIRYHEEQGEGKAEYIESIYDENTSSLYFSSDKFSDFAIAMTPIPEAESQQAASNTTAKTGDNTNVWIYFMLALIAMGVALTITSVRRKRTK